MSLISGLILSITCSYARFLGISLFSLLCSLICILKCELCFLFLCFPVRIVSLGIINVRVYKLVSGNNSGRLNARSEVGMSSIVTIVLALVLRIACGKCRRCSCRFLELLIYLFSILCRGLVCLFISSPVRIVSCLVILISVYSFLYRSGSFLLNSYYRLVSIIERHKCSCSCRLVMLLCNILVVCGCGNFLISLRLFNRVLYRSLCRCNVCLCITVYGHRCYRSICLSLCLCRLSCYLVSLSLLLISLKDSKHFCLNSLLFSLSLILIENLLDFLLVCDGGDLLLRLRCLYLYLRSLYSRCNVCLCISIFNYRSRCLNLCSCSLSLCLIILCLLLFCLSYRKESCLFLFLDNLSFILIYFFLLCISV